MSLRKFDKRVWRGTSLVLGGTAGLNRRYSMYGFFFAEEATVAAAYTRNVYDHQGELRAYTIESQNKLNLTDVVHSLVVKDKKVLGFIEEIQSSFHGQFEDKEWFLNNLLDASVYQLGHHLWCRIFEHAEFMGFDHVIVRDSSESRYSQIDADYPIIHVVFNKDLIKDAEFSQQEVETAFKLNGFPLAA